MSNTARSYGSITIRVIDVGSRTVVYRMLHDKQHRVFTFEARDDVSKSVIASMEPGKGYRVEQKVRGRIGTVWMDCLVLEKAGVEQQF